jgi:hypothetical protein
MRFRGTPLLFSVLLVGCGSISISGGEVDEFSPQSQVWLSKASDAGRTHELILSSVSDYCRLKRTAEGARIGAQAEYQARLDAGDPECESFDLLVDDLHDAYRNLEKSGARQLRIVLDKADVGETPEATTPPTVGRYAQLGGGIGGFDAQLHYWEDDWWGAYAEAYNCLSPDDLDLDALLNFQTEEAPSALKTYPISAGEVELSGGDDGAWEVVLSGDLLRGNNTIGTIQAEFTTEECAIVVVDEAL